MAWTTPKTWASGETLTAANFNTHIRDNQLVTPHLLAYKSADESLTSNTTLQDDDHLFFAMTANEIYSITVGIHALNTAGTSNLKLAFTLPASATMMLQVAGRDPSNVADVFLWTASGTSQSLRTFSVGQFYSINGVVTNAGTAGNFQVQWAQNTSVGTALVVKKGSTITGMKLA